MTGRMKARLIMKSRIPRYVCHRQWRADSCANKLQVRVEEMNEAVLSAVEEHALTPEDIEQVIQLTERDEVRDQKEALEREKKDIARRLEHLTEAIETGGDAPTLVAKIRKLEARCPAIDREIKDLQPVPRFAPVVLENRLAEWRDCSANPRPRAARYCSGGPGEDNSYASCRGLRLLRPDEIR